MFINDNIIKQIRVYPHLIGNLVGFNDLSEIHSKWIRYTWESNKNVSLMAHRNSFKTTAISIIGCVWWLLFNPNDRIAIIRKTFTDASLILKTIVGLFDLPEILALYEYVHRFAPKTIMSRDNIVYFNFKNTKTPDGNLNAFGIDGRITGHHFDKIICDDIITREDRYSRTIREKTKEAVREIQTNIIEPGKFVFYDGTPWHRDDAWAILPKPLKFSINELDILTNEQIDDKRSKTTTTLFSINYLLKHTASENALFSDVKFDIWNNNTQFVIGHLDAKYSGTDTNALTFLSKDKHNQLHAVGFSFNQNIKEKYDFVEEKCKLYNCGSFYKENNNDQGFVADEFRNRGILVNDYHESMNKHAKIESFLGKYWNDITWSHDTDAEYLEQITQYEEGAEPDDAPDSIACLCRVISGKNKNMDRWKL